MDTVLYNLNIRIELTAIKKFCRACCRIRIEEAFIWHHSFLLTNWCIATLIYSSDMASVV